MDNIYFEIRKFLAKHRDNGYLPEQIAKEIGKPANVVAVALIRLVDSELAQVQKIGGEWFYFSSAPFVARKIIPLFAGTPEWIVETAEGRLCCWCPTEFDARTIADSMSRS